MPYSARIKRLAQSYDPTCWISYSGRPVEFKRAIEVRRQRALKLATEHVCYNLDHKEDAMRHSLAEVLAGLTGELKTPFSTVVVPKAAVQPYNPPLLKIAMMIHFATVAGPFAPEKTRTSPAYTKFVRQLLDEGMIERPTKRERAAYPGWAYRVTPKGRAYVDALRLIQLPVTTVEYQVFARGK